MKTTARFELERRRQLKTLFNKKRLIHLWQNLVKKQIRTFDIKDLHDYYDFNYSIDSRVDIIVDRVLSGHYRAEAPLVYRLEKKLGICRHCLIPSPSDALVFQLLTDVLYDSIIKAQPSKGAFYARDRHNLTLPHQHKDAVSYPWFLLWPKFQEEIWKFGKSHKFLVTTDLANYFDNIGLRELRHVISAITKTKEVYLDLLFSLIEDLSWAPDYLPTSHKGLPVINIEAPRLLAHALLFEVDYLLKKRTKNNFVRWMDDINFGTDSLRGANLILGEINDVLKSRGLALNLGKTDVMSSKDAEHHFLFKENLQLSNILIKAKKIKSLKVKNRLAKKVAKNLSLHLQTCTARNKNKLTKRYLTILGILEIPLRLSEMRHLFSNQPALRSSVLNYLSRMPFRKNVATAFIDLLDKTESYDDATRFAFVEAIINWKVPYDAKGKAFVSEIKKRIRKPNTSFEWFCHLFFLIKYGEPNEVLTVSGEGKLHGAREPYFARQRMAALPRCLGINPQNVINQWKRERSTGSTDSASVANNLLVFSAKSFPTRRDRQYLYLFPQNHQTPYPIAKFLFLCALAYNETISKKTIKRSEILSHVQDPWYLHWLKLIHPYWF